MRAPAPASARNAAAAPSTEQVLEALRVLASAIAVGREVVPPPAPTLVRIDGPSLAAHGLELRGVLGLVRGGRLKTIRIGRGRFTTTAHLAALVDELEAAPPPGANDEERDELQAAVAKAARRRARRSA
jgi:hypothetical protein